MIHSLKIRLKEEENKHHHHFEDAGKGCITSDNEEDSQSAISVADCKRMTSEDQESDTHKVYISEKQTEERF